MSKADLTKQFIIEKTAHIFNTKGYAGTSLSDITDATGLTKGSIYGNFKNKDEVALAALQHNLNKIMQLFALEVSKKDKFRDKLNAYPDVYEKYLLKSFPVGGCPILNTAIESDDTHPKLKEMANNALIAWKENLVNLIEKGIEKNEFKKDINPEQTALTMLATIEGAVMIIKLTGKINYLNSILNSLRVTINEL